MLTKNRLAKVQPTQSWRRDIFYANNAQYLLNAYIEHVARSAWIREKPRLMYVTFLPWPGTTIESWVLKHARKENIGGS